MGLDLKVIFSKKFSKKEKVNDRIALKHTRINRQPLATLKGSGLSNKSVD
ncbi:MAG: hypothetical protein LR001_02870 [Clostridiales bacterium]|nr:hypothetical protein [Clostridiales bacterium]